MEASEDSEHRGSAFGTRSKAFDHYASGTDGMVARSILRKASDSDGREQPRAAFLLAPRRGRTGETLAADWSAFRDASMVRWRWKDPQDESREYSLKAAGECNL